MINFFTVISLETWSHIAGVMGLISVILSAVFAWRKQLLKTGFSSFQDLYRIEMSSFKTEVRGYINKADERHTKTLDRIAQLYEKTHQEIESQNMICKVIQGKKPAEIKAERQWKKKIEDDLQKLDQKVTHIEDCVNNGRNNR